MTDPAIDPDLRELVTQYKDASARDHSAALPPEFHPVRDAARRAIAPIKPADGSTKAEEKFLFTAVRTNAGRRLPPYYLVYFLLVDLLGFKDLGRFEKLAWSVPIDFEGNAYLIEHRKFGVGVFAPEGDEWERSARRVVGLIHEGVAAAKLFFKWMAETAIKDSKLNVQNVGIKLFRRYAFFRDRFYAVTAEAKPIESGPRSGSETERVPIPSVFYKASEGHQLDPFV